MTTMSGPPIDRITTAVYTFPTPGPILASGVPDAADGHLTITLGAAPGISLNPAAEKQRSS
jgi:hypothetical protein